MIWTRYGGWFKLAAAVLWAAALTGQKWRPFHFRWPEEGLWARACAAVRVPFYYHYYTTELWAAGLIVRELVAFFFLGLLLRGLTVRLRRAAPTAAIVLVAGFALTTEVGQVLVPHRVADVTTVGIEIVGGVLGVLLYARFAATFAASPAAGQSDRNRSAANER